MEDLGKTERAAVEALVGPVNGRPTWPLIRAAAGSVAEIAIVPVQDLLELGSEARMNTPAVPQGNWSWRVPEGQLDAANWRNDWRRLWMSRIGTMIRWKLRTQRIGDR